jgi:hypothetical protein
MLIHVIAFCIAVWVIYRFSDYTSWKDFIFYISLLGTVFNIFALGICMLISVCINLYPVSVSKTDIVSLHNNNSISGTFILGCGTISSTEYYYMYTKNGNSFNRYKLPVDRVSLIEITDDSLPRVETIRYKTTDKLKYVVYSLKETYDVYIPKGTIIQEFKIK